MKTTSTGSTFFLMILVSVAVLLRLPLLDGSFWLDEAAQILESTRPLSQQLSIAQDFQPPLLHLITHFAARFSHSEWWLRTIGALIPGLITIVFTYKTAERLFSRSIAVVATALLVTSSFHIFYSQELRPYSLAACFAIWSWYVLVKTFFETKKFTWQVILSFSLLTTLGLYSTYLYPFVILSQLTYLFLSERKYLKQFFISLVLSGGLFAPWLPSVLEQLQVGQTLRTQLPGWEAVVAIPQLKSLPLALGKFIFGVLNLEINLIFGAACLLLAGTLGIAAKHKGKAFIFSKQMLLIYCWLLVPLVTAWLVSFFIPILQPKRVLYLLPALYLFIAAVSVRPTANFSVKQFFATKTIGLVALVSLFMINVFSSLAYFNNPYYQRENWRDTHQKIITDYPDKAAVIFAFSDAFAPWVWYDSSNYPVFTTGSLTTSSIAEVEATLKKATDYPYLLVFDYLRDLTDPDKKIESVLQGLGYTQKDIITIPNIGFIRVYARDDAVLS